MALHRISLKPLWHRLALIVIPSLVLVGLEIYNAAGIVPDETRSQAQIGHTLRVIAATRTLGESLQDAERGERGFVMTADPAHLAPYETGATQARARLAQLRRLTAGSPEQQQRLDLLEELIDNRLAQLERVIEVCRNEGFETARQLIATDTGSESTEMVTRLIGLVIETERNRLREQRARAAEDRRASASASVIASVLATAVMLLGGALLAIALLRAWRAQANLRESEERFRLLVDSVEDYAILMLDTVGRVISWNGGAQRITGYRPEEIIDSPFTRFYTPEDIRSDLPERELQAAIRQGRTEGEGWRLRKDGSRFWANAVLATVRDAKGTLRGFALVTRDMTERRQQQQALEQSRAALAQSQKMEAVGQLTGGIAHDFNNLLTTIVGSVDLLQRRAAELSHVETDRLLGVVQRAADQGAALTRRLLAFSKRQALEPQIVEINQLVGAMSDFIRRTLGESVVVEVVPAARLWRVEVDRHQLEGAILNLAINARDAMSEGGKLTIETGNTCLDEHDARAQGAGGPGQYVMLAVSDTGAGMSTETMAHAFEPFFTTKPEGKGTGLGLSQVYSFVKHAGGHVTLRSEGGRGTTVKIYLPRSRATRVPAPPPAEREGVRDAQGETLLVVEDDPDVRGFSASALDHLGYRVLEAGDAAEALRLLAEHREVALLFTDVGLPGLNGRQLAEKARGLVPHLRILYTTGYARSAIPAHGSMDAGVDLLPKPFTVEGLGRKLQQMLRGQ